MNNYLNFERGEISIYLSGDALANLQCSLEQAEAIRREKRHGAVLYVNTSFTARKFRSAWREHIGRDGGLDSRLRGNDNGRSGNDSGGTGIDKSSCHPRECGDPGAERLKLPLDSRLRGNDKEGRIFSLNCPIGELLWYFDDMKEMVKKHNIRQIIINNWEYAFKNYQNKEEAIFRLHEFLNYDVSLLVYAQANPARIWAGKIMRGGLGKLSGLALSIIDLAKESQTVGRTFLSVPEAITGTSKPDKNVRPTETNTIQNINLVASNINDLDSAQQTLVVQEQEETGGSVFSVNETGLVSHNNNAKHLPMSNKNRKLLTEYEKLYGKDQLPGENYRNMFDRVVGKMLSEKAEMREMVEA